MLTFDCGHSAMCWILYVELLNSSTMFFKSKKLFFLNSKKMFLKNIIGEIIQLQYMSRTKRKEKIGLVDFRDFKM